MINLPNEVLHLIFTLLVQQDKLECMTVCQQWHDVIYHQSLFTTIFINDIYKLWNLMKKVERNPLLGTKVKRLVLELRFDRIYSTNTFVELFPSLRQISFLNKNDFIHYTVIRPQQSHPWRENIESLVELNSEEITKSLLHSGLCKKLTYISVEGQSFSYGERFFKALENAPALKKLHLKKCFVSFYDLEMLHDKVPLLDSLSLESVYSITNSIPLNIRPATFLKSFRCIMSYIDLEEDFDFSEVRNPHMQYISQKYTHLEELELELEEIYNTDENDDEVNLVNSLTYQQNTIRSYLKTLGLRLEKLSLIVSSFYNSGLSGGFDLSLLDQCGCQIKSLKLGSSITVAGLEELAKSTQAKYIQSLNLIQDLNYDSQYISTDWLRSFTTLKELHLYATGSRGHKILHLTDLLNNLDETRLETLGLNNLQLQFNDSNINQLSPLLKELSFFNVEFETGIDAFISWVFPNLKRLKMDRCLRHGDVFMLPNTCLSYLEIRNWYLLDVLHVLVKTLDDDQTRLYNSTVKRVLARFDQDDVEDDPFILPPIYSQPFNTSTTVPKVTIVCKSVFNFFMVNYDNSHQF